MPAHTRGLTWWLQTRVIGGCRHVPNSPVGTGATRDAVTSLWQWTRHKRRTVERRGTPLVLQEGWRSGYVEDSRRVTTKSRAFSRNDLLLCHWHGPILQS
eukprot:356623-Chlamydomonas_euryale.AAC.6